MHACHVVIIYPTQNEIHHDNEDKMDWFETLNLQCIPSQSYFNNQTPKTDELVFYDPWEDYGKQSNQIDDVQSNYDQPKEEIISHKQFTHSETFSNEIPVITETINETFKSYETQNRSESSTHAVVHTDSVIHVLQQDHISKEHIVRPIPKIFQKIPKQKTLAKKDQGAIPKTVQKTIQFQEVPKHVQEPIPEVLKHVQEPIPEIPKHVQEVPKIIQESIPSNKFLIEEKLSSSNIEVMATNAENEVGILLIELHV